MRAPLRSSTALVATVVPCTKRAICCGAMPHSRDHVLDRVQHARARIGARRGNLDEAEIAAVAAADDVGERAADVHADLVAGGGRLPSSVGRSLRAGVSGRQYKSALPFGQRVRPRPPTHASHSGALYPGISRLVPALRAQLKFTAACGVLPLRDVSTGGNAHHLESANMIRAAIIGLGRWGQNLVNSVQGKSDVIRFTAGATRTVEKAEAYAREKGIPAPRFVREGARRSRDRRRRARHAAHAARASRSWPRRRPASTSSPRSRSR